MRAFAGNTTAAAFDGGAAKHDTDGHTGNGQYYDNEAREVQHDAIRVYRVNWRAEIRSTSGFARAPLVYTPSLSLPLETRGRDPI